MSPAPAHFILADLLTPCPAQPSWQAFPSGETAASWGCRSSQTDSACRVVKTLTILGNAHPIMTVPRCRVTPPYCTSPFPVYVHLPICCPVPPSCSPCLPAGCLNLVSPLILIRQGTSNTRQDRASTGWGVHPSWQCGQATRLAALLDWLLDLLQSALQCTAARCDMIHTLNHASTQLQGKPQPTPRPPMPLHGCWPTDQCSVPVHSLPCRRFQSGEVRSPRSLPISPGALKRVKILGRARSLQTEYYSAACRAGLHTMGVDRGLRTHGSTLVCVLNTQS